MIKTIRDDVIKLESFVAAAFKYNDELTIINEVGGYCLVSQLKNKYGETKAKRMLEDMQQHKLVYTEYYSNSKYAYLTQNALKYLANRENIDNKINEKRKNIEKNPPEKVLVASILKYQIENEHPSIQRTKYIKQLEEKILEIKELNKIISIDTIKATKEKYIKSKEGVIKLIEVIKPYTNNNQELKKIISVSEKQYNEKIEKYNELIEYCNSVQIKLDIYTKTAITLYDMSKIILLPEDKDNLQIYIIDYSKIKTISKYFQDVYNFEKIISRVFKNIRILFVSYKKERYQVFARKLNNYIKENNTKRNIELIEVDTCYKLGNIIERNNNIGNEEIKVEVKPKDKLAYNKIKEQLSNK